MKHFWLFMSGMIGGVWLCGPEFSLGVSSLMCAGFSGLFHFMDWRDSECVKYSTSAPSIASEDDV